jgi:Asp-tRNA(Asn)/Glu-tRNA(Gln) amidotransferase B subunit
VLRMIATGRLSGRMAKPVVAALAGGDGASLAAVVERECGGAMVTDEGELRALCEVVVGEMTEQVVAYRAGKSRLMGLFVGQVSERSPSSLSATYAESEGIEITRDWLSHSLSNALRRAGGRTNVNVTPPWLRPAEPLSGVGWCGVR